MIQPDTVKLLKECNSGIKMGISGINDLLPSIKDRNLLALLSDSKKEHEKLGNETHTLLTEYNDNGKEPHLMSKNMAKIKTSVTMAVNSSDSTAASLLTDGCNMGIKSLTKYLNQYKNANEKAKNITKRLINIEERLCEDLRIYLK